VENPVKFVDPDGKDFIDFIPIVGSGRDIYNGAKNGDWLTLGIGVAGLALDVVTLGEGSALKGGVKSALKMGAKEVAADEVKSVGRTLTKAEILQLNRSVGKAWEKQITETLIKKFSKENVKSQITGVFKDGTRVVFDDVILKDGKVVAVNESKSGAAKLSKQQARFFEQGEEVTFVGQKAKDAGILNQPLKSKNVTKLLNGKSM
jgi:hypothetical protein